MPIHPLGILLPDSILSSGAVAVLTAFVAINTIMYVSLAVAKMLPKVYLSDLVTHRNRRRENRGIHPDAPVRPHAVRSAPWSASDPPPSSSTRH